MFRMTWVHSTRMPRCCDKRVYFGSTLDSLFKIHSLSQVFAYRLCYKMLAYTEIQCVLIDEFTVLVASRFSVQPVGGNVMCCGFSALSTIDFR